MLDEAAPAVHRNKCSLNERSGLATRLEDVSMEELSGGGERKGSTGFEDKREGEGVRGLARPEHPTVEI